ncbi:MAG: hypothetical protein CMJ18_27740, partial [Phycisphaeraceae bacterium]|nr:hypothetical protein [Phycisphaeraceae bacterium]
MQRTVGQVRTRGIATLELAIGLTLMMLVLFALIEFGAVFYVRHNMVLAAREGARHLAVRGNTGVAAQQVALDQLESITADFTAHATETVTDNGNEVSVEIRVPLEEVAVA